MDMRTAFDVYFERLNLFSKEEYGTKPTVSFSVNLVKKLLVSEPDEDGEVEWAPVAQTTVVNWKAIENNLGFALQKEFKEYLSTYYFLSLTGILGNAWLGFYPIDGSIGHDKIIQQFYNDAQYVFPGTELFLIGTACIDDDDGYFIYYDNADNSVFCHESDTDKRVDVEGRLSDIVGSMEARD